MRLPPHSLGPRLAERTWPWPVWLADGGGDDGSDGGDPDGELQNWSSLIGIVTAICGNVLIALALNVQRYAHIRLHRRRLQIRERARQAVKNAAAVSNGRGGAGGYGAADTSSGDSDGSPAGQFGDDGPRASEETDPLAHSFPSADSDDGAHKEEEDAASSTYLKDPYWWLGQVLITVGELGNFLAYGFAPASIVSPLGVVALVSNCVIAPLFFNEAFRPRDFWGVLIAIMGAVTVVLSAKTEETKLGPHEVWDAITTLEFEIYMAVTCGLMALLVWLSPRYGSKTILIDLGLVGLFGGYTALSTKGVSSMLSSTLLGAFTTPVTYVLVFVLLFTAVMQVRYLNKALQRFESTQVIPVQFVLFTLCVIVGSAVLYRDFERTTSEQAVKFVGGCLLTFFGVFVITSGRPRQDDGDEATLSDAEGIEETIGLAEQDRAPPPTPPRSHGPTPARSRGSPRTSHASFSDASARSLGAFFSHGYRSARGHPAAPRRPLFLDDDDHDGDEDSPLLGNPWHDAPQHSLPTRPSAGLLHTFSADSILSAAPSTARSDSDLPRNSTLTMTAADSTTTKPLPPLPPTTPPRISLLSAASRAERPDRPATPRAPASASRVPTLASHVYSPSPFSSALNAVVGDKLLAHIDGKSAQGYGGSAGLLPPPPLLPGAAESPHSHAGSGLGRSLGFGFGSVSVSVSPRRIRGRDGEVDGDGDARRGSLSTGVLTEGGNGDGGDGDGAEGSRTENESENENESGLRSRARSLSQTLGLAGLLGGHAGARRAALVRRDTDDGWRSAVYAELGPENHAFGGPLERARTAGDG